jgi:hypothetical protein
MNPNTNDLPADDDFSDRDSLFNIIDMEDVPGEAEEDGTLKTLFLTKNEALYLDDQCTMLFERDMPFDGLLTLRPQASTGGVPAPLDLIERLGLAILYTTDPDHLGQEGMIKVNRMDLYVIREAAMSFIKIDGEDVGTNLKRKVYALLLDKSYNSDKTTSRLLSDLPASIFEEPLGVAAEYGDGSSDS